MRNPRKIKIVDFYCLSISQRTADDTFKVLRNKNYKSVILFKVLRNKNYKSVIL